MLAAEPLALQPTPHTAAMCPLISHCPTTASLSSPPSCAQLFWNGATSTIQELEKKWFGAGGLPPNEAVAKLVESLKAGQPVDKAGPLFTLFDSGSSSS